MRLRRMRPSEIYVSSIGVISLSTKLMGPSDCPAASRTRIATLQKRRRAFRYVRLAMCFRGNSIIQVPKTKYRIRYKLQYRNIRDLAAFRRLLRQRQHLLSIIRVSSRNGRNLDQFKRSRPEISLFCLTISSTNTKLLIAHLSDLTSDCQSLLPCCIFRAYD
jgi:hypothetical protein